MSPSNRRKTGLERVLRPHIVETLAAPPFATRAVFCEGKRALQEAPGDLRRARSTLRSPTVTMSTCTLTWDEDEGGDRDPDRVSEAETPRGHPQGTLGVVKGPRQSKKNGFEAGF